MTAVVMHGGLAPGVREGRAASDAEFDAFYVAGFQRLTLQLYAYLGDLAEAQDLVQEAYCRAYARWSAIRRYEDPVAWVRRVAWNLATSRIRRLSIARRFLRRQPREQHVDGPDPDRVALTRALSALPVHHRRAVVLHYMAQLPIGEIAVQEGVAEGTVKSWLSRGRAALAAQLAEPSTQSQQTTTGTEHRDA